MLKKDKKHSFFNGGLISNLNIQSRSCKCKKKHPIKKAQALLEPFLLNNNSIKIYPRIV